MAMSMEDVAVAIGEIKVIVTETRADVRETKDHAQATNGRVTILEGLRIADEAVRKDRAARAKANAWRRPAAVSLSATFGVFAGTALLHFAG